MNKMLAFAVGLLLLNSIAQAQTPVVPQYNYTLRVYVTGGQAPIQSTTAPSTAAVCGLVPTPPLFAPVINPTFLEFDDPALAGKACRIPLAAFFGGLPISLGQYVATVTFTDLSNPTTESAQVSTNPFERRAVLPSPSNPRLIGGGGF